MREYNFAQGIKTFSTHLNHMPCTAPGSSRENRRHHFYPSAITKMFSIEGSGMFKNENCSKCLAFTNNRLWNILLQSFKTAKKCVY